MFTLEHRISGREDIVQAMKRFTGTSNIDFRTSCDSGKDLLPYFPLYPYQDDNNITSTPLISDDILPSSSESEDDDIIDGLIKNKDGEDMYQFIYDDFLEELTNPSSDISSVGGSS